MQSVTSFKGEFAFLSNFYPATTSFMGHDWPTSEHAYQAAKAPDNPHYVAQIKACITPGAAKRRARMLKDLHRPGWHMVKVNVMEAVLVAKFTQPEMRDKLVKLKDYHIEEGNQHGDTFWGTVDGIGHNMLGLLLMKVAKLLDCLESKA